MPVAMKVRPILVDRAPARVPRRESEHLVPGDPDDALGRGVAFGDASLGVVQDESFRHRAENILEPRLAIAEGGFGLAQVGHIAIDADPPHRLARGVADGGFRGLEYPAGPVGAT